MNNVLIVGAGNMGEAMLKGWLKANNMLKQVYVREPDPSNWLKKVHNEKKILLNPSNIIGKIDVGIFAVKPQVAEKVILDTKIDLSKKSFVISVIAGKDFNFFDKVFDVPYPVVRVMPNTPVAIEQGVSAIIGNSFSSLSQVNWTEELFNNLGKTVILEKESQIDAVTAI